MISLLTVGHSDYPQERLLEILNNAGVELLVDVRSFPGSRKHPHFSKERMEVWIPQGGIKYNWNAELGGFRKPQKDTNSPGLRHKSFQAYGDYMLTPTFHSAMIDLLKTAKDCRVAVMCSESCWWRCHRRLISDAATMLFKVDVRHIMGKKTTPHKPTDTACVQSDQMRYFLPSSDEVFKLR